MIWRPEEEEAQRQWQEYIEKAIVVAQTYPLFRAKNKRFIEQKKIEEVIE